MISHQVITKPMNNKIKSSLLLSLSIAAIMVVGLSHATPLPPELTSAKSAAVVDPSKAEIDRLTAELAKANTALADSKKELEQHTKDAQSTLDLVLQQRNEINSNLANLQIITRQTSDRLAMSERRASEAEAKLKLAEEKVTAMTAAKK